MLLLRVILVNLSCCSNFLVFFNILYFVFIYQKDLVVCEHDILSARRISDASSTWSSYASGPGASSESATTSVYNKSYSGPMQRSDDATVRSDDVTVDSTITRKHTVRFSLHNRDADRNTADSSTSTISYKHKLDDGESLAHNNLQESPATALLELEDVERKSTDKKVHTFYEYFALIHDRRLYIPFYPYCSFFSKHDNAA
jgi:hypothetical protein